MIDKDIKHEHVRPMTLKDLELVHAWRNHPDVRNYMYSQHEIGLVEHQCWFDKVNNDPLKHSLIFEVEGVSLGFVSLSQLGESCISDWGFYVAPEAPKGSGRRLGAAALHYAFDTLKQHKVCGQVLSYNQGSIRLHQNLGFQQEGLLRDQHFDGKKYHDVFCFGLLSIEWQSRL